MNQPKTFRKLQCTIVSKFQVCAFSINSGDDDNNLLSSQI